MTDLPLKGSEDYDRLVERFWAKVAEEVEGCWIWTAALDPSGYGRFGTDGKKTRLAHHVAYYLEHGVDPQGRVVMHLCDTPSCVYPGHLKIGTHRENAQDKVQKRRHAGQRQTGEAHGRTRLTDEQASAVMTLLACGFSISSCARIFGVSTGPITAIRNMTRPATSTSNWKAS